MNNILIINRGPTAWICDDPYLTVCSFLSNQTVDIRYSAIVGVMAAHQAISEFLDDAIDEVNRQVT